MTSFGFCSFSSGSSGNCYLVRSEKTALLIDAGISRKKILEGLEKTGTQPDRLQALLITHEHTDHIKGIDTLLRKEKELAAYANAGTWAAIRHPVADGQKRTFVTGESFTVGDISVKTFAVSHDAADPVGYTLTHGSKQISLVTDTGSIGETLLSELKDADLLVLEANHDEDMLKFGRYSQLLKQRVLGNHGHLSNKAAGNALVRLLEAQKKKRCVLLAHLSGENNFPEMALQTIKNILEEKKYYTGGDLYLNTILREEISLLYEI